MVLPVIAAWGVIGSAEAANPWSVRADGTLMKDSEPYLVLGSFHTSKLRTDAQTANDLRASADNQGNTFQMHLGTRTDSPNPQDAETLARLAADRALLQLAEQRNQAVFGTISYNRRLDVVDLYRDAPDSLAAVVTRDDASGFNAATLQQIQQQVRTVDPDRLTLISFNNAGGNVALAPYADLLAMQIYPVDNIFDAPTADPIFTGHYLFEGVAQDVFDATGKRMMLNGQSFGWRDGPGTVRPTPRQLRALTYSAFNSGANGVVYYAMVDGYTEPTRFELTQDLPVDDPALWAEMGVVFSELKQLEGFLLDGNRTVRSNDNAQNDTPSISAAFFEHEGQAVVSVINLMSRFGQPVGITLPASLADAVEMERVFGEGNLRIQNGRIVGNLAPEASGVYRLRPAQVIPEPAGAAAVAAVLGRSVRSAGRRRRGTSAGATPRFD